MNPLTAAFCLVTMGLIIFGAALFVFGIALHIKKSFFTEKNHDTP